MQNDCTIPPQRIARFWSRVNKTPTCWLWTGSCFPKGYGRFCSQREMPAHRFSWLIHCGPIPDGLFVCHHCDTPGCVRPDHLFLGTGSDNMQDAIAKGRFGRMAIPPEKRTGFNAKLTPEDVKAIREIAQIGRWSRADLASLFHVTAWTISAIVHRRAWKYV